MRRVSTEQMESFILARVDSRNRALDIIGEVGVEMIR